MFDQVTLENFGPVIEASYLQNGYRFSKSVKRYDENNDNS